MRRPITTWIDAGIVELIHGDVMVLGPAIEQHLDLLSLACSNDTSLRNYSDFIAKSHCYRPCMSAWVADNVKMLARPSSKCAWLPYCLRRRLRCLLGSHSLREDRDYNIFNSMCRRIIGSLWFCKEMDRPSEGATVKIATDAHTKV